MLLWYNIFRDKTKVLHTKTQKAAKIYFKSNVFKIRVKLIKSLFTPPKFCI